MKQLFIYIFIALLSYVGVEIFRRWSLSRNLLDVPNQRSSHTVPTPRGAGLVIVLNSLLVFAIYTLWAGEDLHWGYIVGAILVAGISYLDDIYSVAFVWRFCIHAAAALLAIYSSGYFREFYILLFQETLGSEIFGVVLTFFWIVWLTNAYNFMDGIDGIAGIQALAAGFGWFVIGNLLGADSIGFYGGVVACSALGFLIHNWQPAKIFMGDVGSAFLGYTFAVLPLLAEREIAADSKARQLLPLAAIFLNWLFIFDTVYTFIRRLLRREKVWEAHRAHIYQKFVSAGYAHQTISIVYGGISLVTVLITIFWVINQKNFESSLIFFVILQSCGILIYLYWIEKPD
jgi:UDP-N-acetylmuramyl pentapeptide phosphotransferase/UDP-N-acetylglucosamine-1-phosphate transferase